MKKFFITGFVILLAVLALSANAQAAPLGGKPNVNLADNRAGEATTHSISFKTSSTGAISGGPFPSYIDVEYATGFNIASATLANPSANLGAASLTINGQFARVMLGSFGSVANDEEVSFDLVGVVNHQTSADYRVAVSTYNYPNTLVDGPTYSYYFSIQPRAPNNITLSPTGPQQVSADTHSIVYTADVRDMYNNSVEDGTPVGWNVSNANFSVSDAVTSTINGQTSVTVTTPTTAGQSSTLTAQSGVSATSGTITVIHGDAIGLTLSPVGPLNLTADDSQIFTTTAVDQYGNSWDATTSASYFENDPIGNFVGNTYNAGQVGSWTIYASINGINSNNVIVNVSHGQAASVTISPADPLNLTADDSQAFTVTAYDADGNSWDASSIATYNENDPVGSFIGNTYYAGQVGTWTIYATVDGNNSNNVTVNVSHGVVVSVDINPKNVSLTADQNQQFTLTAYDADGNSWDVSSQSLWNTTDPWGNITSGGLYSTGQVGIWQINVTYMGYSTYTDVFVSHGQAVSIDIQPANATITADQYQIYTVTAYDADGNAWDVTDQSNYAIDPAAGGYWDPVSVNIYNAQVAGGPYPVTATYNGLTDTVQLTVTPGALHHINITPATDQIITAGQTVLFTAQGYDQYNNPIPGQSFSWNNTDVNGLFTQTTAGIYIVYAYVDTVQSNHVNVTVNPGPLDHINITPNTDQTITAGQTVQFIAQGYDQHNNAIADLIYTWTNADANGLFNNTITGIYPVQAHSGGIDSNIVNVTVNPGPVHRLEISPNTDQTITAGQTVQFITTVYDQYNNVIIDVTISWQNADAGLFSQTAAGSYVVFAFVNDIKSNQVKVTVNPGPAAKLVFNSTPETIYVDDQFQFTVKVYDAYDNEIANPALTWSVENQGGEGTIDTNGKFTAGKAGKVLVKVAVDGLSLGVTFTIKEKPAPQPSSEPSKEDTTQTTSEQAAGTTTGQKTGLVSTAQAAPEEEVEEEGEVKGTEITTIGPDDEGKEAESSAWPAWLTVLVACLVLVAAYLAYTYWVGGKAVKVKQTKLTDLPKEPDTDEEDKSSKDETRW